MTSTASFNNVDWNLVIVHFSLFFFFHFHSSENVKKNVLKFSWFAISH